MAIVVHPTSKTYRNFNAKATHAFCVYSRPLIFRCVCSVQFLMIKTIAAYRCTVSPQLDQSPKMDSGLKMMIHTKPHAHPLYDPFQDRLSLFFSLTSLRHPLPKHYVRYVQIDLAEASIVIRWTFMNPRISRHPPRRPALALQAPRY